MQGLRSMALQAYSGLSKLLNNVPKFVVYINEGEWLQIQNWVLLKPDIETGGDLFGLWIDRHTCIVQFVIGPGQGCGRSKNSFYQSIPYLKASGDYLSQKHGLCNVGQWHSHHRIGLRQPSGGDRNTVWSNMKPELGLSVYIMLIATIEGTRQEPSVEINGFLFEIDADGERCPIREAEFKFLSDNSPLRINHEVYGTIANGAESTNTIKLTRGELESLERQNVNIEVESYTSNEVNSESEIRALQTIKYKHEHQAFLIEMKDFTPTESQSENGLPQENKPTCNAGPPGGLGESGLQADSKPTLLRLHCAAKFTSGKQADSPNSAASGSQNHDVALPEVTVASQLSQCEISGRRDESRDQGTKDDTDSTRNRKFGSETRNEESILNQNGLVAESSTRNCSENHSTGVMMSFNQSEAEKATAMETNDDDEGDCECMEMDCDTQEVLPQRVVYETAL